MSKLIYLLDTNTISEMARNPQGSVVKRLAQVGEESVGLSIVVACEIRFGLLKKGSRTLKDNMEQILEALVGIQGDTVGRA
jgi:tRNA(fMet)-specific endonuclease VapC